MTQAIPAAGTGRLEARRAYQANSGKNSWIRSSSRFSHTLFAPCEIWTLTDSKTSCDSEAATQKLRFRNDFAQFRNYFARFRNCSGARFRNYFGRFRNQFRPIQKLFRPTQKLLCPDSETTPPDSETVPSRFRNFSFPIQKLYRPIQKPFRPIQKRFRNQFRAIQKLLRPIQKLFPRDPETFLSRFRNYLRPFQKLYSRNYCRSGERPQLQCTRSALLAHGKPAPSLKPLSTAHMATWKAHPLKCARSASARTSAKW